MIDFAQESGRAGRGGEMVDSVILVDRHKVQLEKKHGHLRSDTLAMITMVLSSDCRRWVMSEYLDGPALAQRCGDLTHGARCDRCGEGLSALMDHRRALADAWEALEVSLDEMASGCAHCFMVDGDAHRGVHPTSGCIRDEVLTNAAEKLHGLIRYPRGSRGCHRCKIDQRWCVTGRDADRSCQYAHILSAVVAYACDSEFGLALLTRLGFIQPVDGFHTLEVYAAWLSRTHDRRVWDLWMSNSMVVMIEMIQWVQRRDQ